MLTIQYENDSETQRTYTPTKEMMRITNSSGTFDYRYVYAGDKLVARLNPDNSKWYYHGDHLGSTNLVTDDDTLVVEDTMYEPYGEIENGGTQERKLYTGHEQDNTNQIYMKARYYKPETGQFISPDTIIQDVYNPQDLNRYAYVKNNPLKYVDPDGHSALLVAALGVTGAVLNTVSYFASHESPTWQGAVGYAIGGALSGISVLGGHLGAGIGGAGSAAIERYVDEEEITGTEAYVDYVSSAIASGASYGLGKYLPQARTWLIQKPASYIITKTGMQFAKNSILEQAASNIMSQSANSLYSSYTVTSYNTNGFSSSLQCGSSSKYGDSIVTANGGILRKTGSGSYSYTYTDSPTTAPHNPALKTVKRR